MVALSALASGDARVVSAQTPLGSERRDINDLRGDVWSVWSSPARADHRALLPTFAALGGLLTVGALADSATFAWMSTHPNAAVLKMLSPIRESGRFPLYELGSGQYLLPLSGLIYVAGRLSRDAALRDGGLGCFAGHLSSAALREVIYLGVSRARPRVTPHPDRISIPGSRDWNEHSFLSGHAANAMACASFASHRFSLGIVEPAMYVYVAAIGLGRMLDGRHWASDTMAGLAMGFAIGKAIADRQEHRIGEREPPGASLPATGVSAIRWSFAF
jgi:membrane-associated phospholipid phosphatase